MRDRFVITTGTRVHQTRGEIIDSSLAQWSMGQTDLATRIRIEEDGVVREYEKWEDVPPQWQERFRSVGADFSSDGPFNSVDDLPQFVRERLRAINVDPGAAGHVESIDLCTSRSCSDGVSEQTFTYRGPNGVEHTYGSLDEMPAEVRDQFERMRQSRREVPGGG